MGDRAELVEAARAAAELERRRRARPLAYAMLWDQAEPRTSQLRSFRAGLGARGLVLVGGNGTGKTWVAALWALIQALGVDHPDVVAFADRNGLDLARGVPPGPGLVWVCSETFEAAREQIRRHLSALSPEGARTRGWEVARQGELLLPNGGRIISKAYVQYLMRPQTWEGAQIRAVVFDEQPPNELCMGAAFARTRSLAKEAVPGGRWFWLLAYTGLNGKDWLYRRHVATPEAAVPVRWIHGADNPHLDQDQQAAIIASFPAWQRAARERGEFASPVGRRLPGFDRAVHVLDASQMPTIEATWLRWVGVDPGSRHPHAIWVAESAAGDLYVYREYAPRLTTAQPGLAATEWIATCKAFDATDGAVSRYRVADSADPGFLTEAARAGWVCLPAAKGPGSIEDGLNLIEAYLATSYLGQPRRPRLYISSDCPVLIAELEQLRWLPEQPGKAPATDPACEDDGIDGLRYILLLRRAMGRR